MHLRQGCPTSGGSQQHPKLLKAEAFPSGNMYTNGNQAQRASQDRQVAEEAFQIIWAYPALTSQPPGVVSP